MDILSNFLPRINFDSYKDFKENFRVNVPENFDFARDVVDEYAKITPDKRAIVYCNDEGEEETFTFSDVSKMSKQAAAYFTELGIKSGDRVIVLLRRRYEYWICAVALHRIGAVVVPASIQLTTKDIAYRVNTAKAKMVIAINDEYVLEQLSCLKEKCSGLEDIVIIGEQTPDTYHDFNKEYQNYGLYEEPAKLKNSDEMIIYFTSGTSGMPKMAVHNRTYPISHIITAKYMQCVQDDGLHLTQADSGWAKFGWGNIYGQWIAGSAVLAYDPIRFSAKNMLEVLAKHKPTSLCVPPTMYRFLLHEGLKKEHVESINWFSTAGEALSGEVNKSFYEITGKYIHEGYGQSEGTPITCGFQWLDIRPSSMGKPSPLYKTAIVNPDGTECRQGFMGEVVIYTSNKGQLGLLDYYYDGENEKKICPIKNGVYHTGDTAYEDEDGYYWYIGRSDDMIKCSGYRIGPFEIESILNTHPAVKESAIVGCPDEIRGQIVCAVIKLCDGYEGSAELTKELQKYVQKNTAPYKYPRVIKYVDELPKTTSGKIIRNKAKEMLDNK